jgi:hypothetical protein
MQWHSIESQHHIVRVRIQLALAKNDPEYEMHGKDYLSLTLQRHLHRHALQHNELWALQTLMPLVTGP